MNIMNNYDIIIIGAGLSGLTLASELSKKTAKSILILEKKRKFFSTKIGAFGIDHIIHLALNMTVVGKILQLK